MNKRVGLIALVITLLIGGSLVYLISTSEPDEPNQNVGVQNADNSPAGTSPTANQSVSMPGEYIDYREGVIAETSGTVLLFFYAPWCPQCRVLESDIKAKGVPESVTIIKVDYDNNQTLRQKYGVTIQTTIVRVDKDGKLIEKFVAYEDPSLAAVVKELL
jgi:thioredoxin-like negative regulator of GroEL